MQNQKITVKTLAERAPFQGKLLIDGLWCEAHDGSKLERKSPAHDLVVAVYAKAGVIDAERAIEAARRAFDFAYELGCRCYPTSS